jgi:RimJ/RimL family protein N-acetyltransferase
MSDLNLRTARLLLQPVGFGDLEEAVRLGGDERVMASFAGVHSAEVSGAWLEREVAHWQAHSFGRFHVSCAGAFVGFVGLTRYELDAGIVSGVEVAWRLAFDAWGNGYATEAARAVIGDGFGRVGLRDVIAITTPGNGRSLRVMERLGMTPCPDETFEHPGLPPGHPLRTHVLYRLLASDGRWT